MRDAPLWPRGIGALLQGYDVLMAHWRGVLPQNVMLEAQYEEVAADLEGPARRMVAPRAPHIGQARRRDLALAGQNLLQLRTQPQENHRNIAAQRRATLPKPASLFNAALSVPAQAKSSSLAASRTIERNAQRIFTQSALSARS